MNQQIEPRDESPQSTTAPYYQDDLATLYHGDCLEHPEWWTCADVLVTDPPYGLNYSARKGGYRGNETQTRIRQAVASDDSLEARNRALDLWGVRPMIVFGTWKMPRPDRVDHRLIWWKQGQAPGPANAAFMTQDEEIYVSGRGFVRSSPPARSVFPTSEPRSVAVAQAGHPTPKPLALMEWLLNRCPPEWVIADPFTGSGSTLVAAKLLGRQAIGVELEERYCEIAARRLSQDVLDFGGWSA